MKKKTLEPFLSCRSVNGASVRARALRTKNETAARSASRVRIKRSFRFTLKVSSARRARIANRESFDRQ